MASIKFTITLDEVVPDVEELVLSMVEESDGNPTIKGHWMVGFDDWAFTEDGWVTVYHLGDPGSVYFYREKNCYVYLSEDELYLDVFEKNTITNRLSKRKR